MVCGVLIDYEHVKLAGPDLRILMQDLHQTFFESCIIPESLKSGIILPLFKCKGAKANNKDNYRRITLFPTLCKIYQMILINRLDNFAAYKGFFSEMQFGFQEGVGCTEASFTILETMITYLSAVARCSAAFLMFVKPLIQSG